MNKGCKTDNCVWKNLAWAEEEGRGESLQPGRPLSNYSMVSFDIKVTPNFEGLGALLPFQDLIKFGEGFSSKASNLSYWKKKKKERNAKSLFTSAEPGLAPGDAACASGAASAHRLLWDFLFKQALCHLTVTAAPPLGWVPIPSFCRACWWVP